MKKAFEQNLIPGGVPSILESLPGNYICYGKGGRCWDQFGNEFIDFVCGYGTLILGHCNKEVNNEVFKQLTRGVMFPSNNPLFNKLASSLKKNFPCTGGSLFFKTGSEAVSAAIRLARAYTSKNMIIRCGYHGWHDSVISPHISWHLYEVDHEQPRIISGIPKINQKNTLFIRWTGEELQNLEDIFRRHRNKVAALLIDPVQIRGPIEVNIREICRIVHDYEALLILDEAKTGFRVNLGGVQGLYNIQSDLTILSKGISNGFPLSVVIGYSEIMNLATSAKIMGTYNNELLSIVAALKTISILEKPTNIPSLWQIGQKLINGINEILNRHNLLDDIQAVPYRWPCMPFIWFRNSSERAQHIKSSFYRILIEKGTLLMSNHMNFVCLAHTKKDAEETLQTIDDTFIACLPTKRK